MLQLTQHMTELPNQKFKYKKDNHDWIMIGIGIFTLICFAAIFYGIQYFNNYNVVRETDDRNQIDEMIQNRQKLEQQIQEYIEDQDFDPNTEG